MNIREDKDNNPTHGLKKRNGGVSIYKHVEREDESALGRGTRELKSKDEKKNLGGRLPWTLIIQQVR